MDEVKTLGFDWEFGHEELALEVSSYADNEWKLIPSWRQRIR